MLTKKSKYGLKALLLLAKNEDQLLHISRLSMEENIPLKFLQGILLELKNHGVLYSKRGKEGGYKLARPAKDITFGQIMRILDGPLAPIGCVSEMAYHRCDECVDEETCLIRKVMKQVRDRTAHILDNMTLNDNIEIDNSKDFNLTSA
jgi:Rrf2 family protein